MQTWEIQKRREYVWYMSVFLLYLWKHFIVDDCVGGQQNQNGLQKLQLLQTVFHQLPQHVDDVSCCCLPCKHKNTSWSTIIINHSVHCSSGLNRVSVAVFAIWSYDRRSEVKSSVWGHKAPQTKNTCGPSWCSLLKGHNIPLSSTTTKLAASKYHVTWCSM